jgi:DNA-binding response OmpR family regulator
MLSDGAAPGFELSRPIRLADGLQLLDSRQYDVVLLDLTLPDSPGLLTLMKFTVHARKKRVPVIVLTGLDSTMAGSWALQEGAADYLVKGKVDANMLEFSIRYAIEQQRSPSEGRPAQEAARATKGSDVV